MISFSEFVPIALVIVNLFSSLKSHQRMLLLEGFVSTIVRIWLQLTSKVHQKWNNWHLMAAMNFVKLFLEPKLHHFQSLFSKDVLSCQISNLEGYCKQLVKDVFNIVIHLQTSCFRVVSKILPWKVFKVALVFSLYHFLKVSDQLELLLFKDALH